MNIGRDRSRAVFDFPDGDVTIAACALFS